MFPWVFWGMNRSLFQSLPIQSVWCPSHTILPPKQNPGYTPVSTNYWQQVSSLADLCSLLTAPEAQVGTVHLSVCPVQFHCHATVAWGKLWKVQNRVRLHTTTHRGVCPCQGASQNAHLPTGESVSVRVQPRHTITHRGACTQQDAGYIRAEKFSPFFILHSLFPSPSISS